MNAAEALAALRGPLYGKPWAPEDEVLTWAESGGCHTLSDGTGVRYAMIAETQHDYCVRFSGFEFDYVGPLGEIQALILAMFEGGCYCYGAAS